MELFMCAVTVIALFAVFMLGYREGLRLGMRSAKGIEPKPIRNPVKSVREESERVAAENKMREAAEEWDAFEKFDGYTAVERKWVEKDGDG